MPCGIHRQGLVPPAIDLGRGCNPPAMKSPFPGMDPCLERHWRDVHGTLIVHARAELNRRLGGNLRARIEERLVVESPWDEPRSIAPDVRVVEHGLGRRPMAADAGVA